MIDRISPNRFSTCPCFINLTVILKRLISRLFLWIYESAFEDIDFHRDWTVVIFCVVAAVGGCIRSRLGIQRKGSTTEKRESGTIRIIQLCASKRFCSFCWWWGKFCIIFKSKIVNLSLNCFSWITMPNLVILLHEISCAVERPLPITQF